MCGFGSIPRQCFVPSSTRVLTNTERGAVIERGEAALAPRPTHFSPKNPSERPYKALRGSDSEIFPQSAADKELTNVTEVHHREPFLLRRRGLSLNDRISR